MTGVQTCALPISVHVLNVVDGCMPADMPTGSAKLIEEERRLLYVAMTRAKQHLHMLRAAALLRDAAA